MNAGKNQRKVFLTRVDVAILFCVISILVSVGVVVKIVLQRDTFVTVELLVSGGEWWWGTPQPYYWNGKAVEKGAKEFDSLRKPIVEILDVVKYNEDDRSYMWIKARLVAKQNTRTKQYSFRQETLSIGNTIRIAPNNIMLIGNVVGIDGVGSLWNPDYITVTGIAKEIHPWVADSIRVGDKTVDNNGNLVVEVLDKHMELADVMTTTWTGEALKRKNPLLRDVTLTIKMRVMKSDDSRFFSYFQPVGIGKKVRIQFSKMLVEINVMSLQ